MNDTSSNDANDDTTDCDRCGRERPHDPRRFTVTLEDLTDATIQYERWFLCRECWRAVRDASGGCVA